MKVSTVIITFCLLAGSCQAQPWYRSKAFWAGFAAVGSSTAFDYASTRNVVMAGGHEMNPLLGRSPSTARMIGIGVPLTFLPALAGHKSYEAHSRLWWMIPVVASTVHIGLGVHNRGII